MKFALWRPVWLCAVLLSVLGLASAAPAPSFAAVGSPRASQSNVPVWRPGYPVSSDCHALRPTRCGRTVYGAPKSLQR